MKVNIIDIGILSIILFLSMISSTLALPSWLQPERRELELKAPRQYTAYNPLQVEHYSYGGIGPQPTIASSLSTKISATSQADGEFTSREDSSGMLMLTTSIRLSVSLRTNCFSQHLQPRCIHLLRVVPAVLRRSSAPHHRRRLTPSRLTPANPQRPKSWVLSRVAPFPFMFYLLPSRTSLLVPQILRLYQLLFRFRAIQSSQPRRQTVELLLCQVLLRCQDMVLHLRL
jgi:hypothetical protein